MAPCAKQDVLAGSQRALDNGSEATSDTLDVAPFLNGLPVFTSELKDAPSGHTVEDAIRQYRVDRDPREPLYAFGRCLAHFAVDTDLVYVATRLEGAPTRFLPFNKGKAGGAGNPPSALGFATAYLWEDVWRRESVLELVQYFLHVVEEEDEQGRKTGAKSLIFPRFHQLECVRGLVSDSMADGSGKRYLIQHSAGSGKSNSIAWLAHRLSVVHDEDGQRVFDSIVVVTDRRVLGRHVQAVLLYTMRQAIEERFILDVLEHYARHSTYWRLLKTVEDDPHYDKARASYLLRSFVEASEHAIEQNRPLPRGEGLSVQGAVAFSGEVRDGGVTYKEANMNGFPESRIAATFERDENRPLIVAEKFQTGFDQPLLHTMYVDRRLAGVHAVQALSRLNRTHPDKEETLVLDFVNDVEDIRTGFEPYYDRVLLSEGTDPNLLYDLETKVGASHLFGQEELDAFARVYFDPDGDLGALHAVLRVEPNAEAIVQDDLGERL